MNATYPALVVFIFIAFLSAPVESAVIRVPVDESTIQEGVGAAASGDTVLVFRGTYSGPLNRDIDFGGVNVILRSEAGAELTVIDCLQVGSAFRFQSGENPTAVVDGFTITGGRDLYCGAIFCENSSPTIRCCIFEANCGCRLGGAIACYAASPIIEECSFVDNLSTGAFGKGGALFCDEGSSPKISHSVFIGNSSDAGGAVACIGASTPSLLRCLLVENSAEMGGALASLDESHITVESCTIANNTGDRGAGIYCHTASADVVSTIIAFGHQGAAVASWSTGSATLVCCDVYMNENGDWCDCIAGQNGINGNISADPLFCGDDDPLMRHLLHANSPCAPENNPGCGGIGTLGVGCEATPVETISWGSLKARFRSE